MSSLDNFNFYEVKLKVSFEDVHFYEVKLKVSFEDVHFYEVKLKVNVDNVHFYEPPRQCILREPPLSTPSFPLWGARHWAPGPSERLEKKGRGIM